ncbi:uncharacterized protein UBRO2_04720 [Ustilago bromivora]|uniref:Uncharacterized protein n=1 Tax=Ustilago bromivora TaxID=307758 RepID=A0A8H8QRD0_9BASI|nr:uncharacterized protein UBRO2_04720 [Ustilago bromivora]
MSDTPSTQSTRPADNGAMKNFVWQAQDIKHLVDMIYINELHQHTILPSHRDEANEPANKLHKDMVYRDLSRLLFPTSLDVAGNKDSDHVLPSSNPMEESSNADLGHTVHACNLPPIQNLVDATPRNAGDYPDFDISTPTLHPIQLDALVSSPPTFSNRASPSQPNGYKHKHSNVEQKRDFLAEAFYRSLIESLSICLKLAQEHTKQEAECTKQEELRLQHEHKERE